MIRIQQLDKQNLTQKQENNDNSKLLGITTQNKELLRERNAFEKRESWETKQEMRESLHGVVLLCNESN